MAMSKYDTSSNSLVTVHELLNTAYLHNLMFMRTKWFSIIGGKVMWESEHFRDRYLGWFGANKMDYNSWYAFVSFVMSGNAGISCPHFIS